MRIHLFLLLIPIVAASCNLSWHASEEPMVKLRGCVVPVEMKITEYKTSISLGIDAYSDPAGYGLHESALKRDLIFQQDSSLTAVDSLKSTLINSIAYPGYERDCGIKGLVIYEVKAFSDGTLAEPELKTFPKNSFGLQKEAYRALKKQLSYVKLERPENYDKLVFYFWFRTEEIRSTY